MKKAKIYYFTLTDEMRKEEKLDWFRSHSIEQLEFEYINPDKNSNWINLADTDFENLLPLCSKDVKAGRTDEAIFELFTLGAATNRDSWVFDISKENLIKKMKYFSETYNKFIKQNNIIDDSIKWSRDLKKKFDKKILSSFNEKKIVKGLYKPFTHLFFYTEKIFCDVLTQNHYDIFGENLDKTNPCIGIIGLLTEIPFSILSFDVINDLNSLSNAANGNKTYPLYRYDKSGNRFDNITEWALEQFRNHYHLSEPGFSGLKDEQDLTDGKKRKKSGKSARQKNAEPGISKEDIFHYVYAVLHNPAYREKYELNLKREFPRIPFYPDFWKWVKWGKALMDLHINYETAKPFDLKEHHSRTKAESTRQKKAETAKEPEAVYSPKIKPRLKADKEKGIIELDEISFLSGIPKQAWEYRLGNRSALEWILDQYKEKKPKDPTIAEKFNTYRFADYKEHVIDLLKRVCTVSVETMKIVDEMKKIPS